MSDAGSDEDEDMEGCGTGSTVPQAASLRTRQMPLQNGFKTFWSDRWTTIGHLLWAFACGD